MIGIREKMSCTVLVAELPRADWGTMKDLVSRLDCRVLRAYTIKEMLTVLSDIDPDLMILQEMPYELTVGGLTVSRYTHEVCLPDRSVLLTPVEMDLVWFLAEQPDRWFSVEQLLLHVWGELPGTKRGALVRVHVLNIRKKIEPDRYNPRYLLSAWMHGYMLSSGAGTMDD